MRGFLLLVSVSLFTLCLVMTRTQPARAETSLASFKDYRKWVLVTPTEVDMTPDLALSCFAPSIVDSSPANPHASRVFKVYVNPLGKDAMASQGKKTFPVGSIIVKEKFARPPGQGVVKLDPLPKDAKPELLTAMVKRENGFDAANGDWEYVALSGDASKKSTQGLRHCAECHQTERKSDYVFGDYGSIHHGEWRMPSPPFTNQP